MTGALAVTGFALTSSSETMLTYGPGACYLVGGSNYRVIHSGSRVWQLSDEDTEDDAVARATASGWSSYGGCFSGLPCCEASRTARGAGVFTFTYAEARVKLVFSGLLSGSSATIYLTVYYRDLATLATGEHSVISANVTADGSGAGEHVFDIPNPPTGFAYYAQSASYEITDLNIDPATWSACVVAGDGWAGQLYASPPSEGVAYNFVQHRAAWPGAALGVTRTVRFYWETSVYGADSWSDDGYTDVPITGVSLPAVTYTDWVDVPNEEGFQTRLRNARLLPP